jgi:hypothetical protein
LQNAVAQVEPDPNNGRPQQWMVGGGGTPDCQVSLRQKPEMGTTLVEKPVPLCAPGRTNATADAPCWQIITSNQCMQEMQVCYNAGCTVDARPANAVNAQVACALFLPP